MLGHQVDCSVSEMHCLAHCDLNVVHTSFGTNKTRSLQTVHSHWGVIGEEGPLVGVGDGGASIRGSAT